MLHSLVFTPRALYERFHGLWDFLIFTFAFYVVWKIIFQTALAGAFKRQTGGLEDKQVEKYSNLLALAAALASTIAIQIRGASLQTFATSGLLEIFLALVAAVITYMTVHDPKKKNIGKSFVWSLVVFLITMIMLIAMYATESAALGNIIGIGIVVGLIVLLYALAKHTPAAPTDKPKEKKEPTGRELENVINVLETIKTHFEGIEQSWTAVGVGGRRGRRGGLPVFSIEKYVVGEAQLAEGNDPRDPNSKDPEDDAMIQVVLNMRSQMSRELSDYLAYKTALMNALEKLDEVGFDLYGSVYSEIDSNILDSNSKISSQMEGVFNGLVDMEIKDINNVDDFVNSANTFYSIARGAGRQKGKFSDIVYRVITVLKTLKTGD